MTMPGAIPDTGDTVTFGSCPQTEDGNDRTPLRWTVLEKEADRALLITEQGIAVRTYHIKREPVTWETCYLRRWLNGPFLADAFTPEEREIIRESEVPADRNPGHAADPGNATYDRVFLLSIPEAERYFASDAARQCRPTALALKNGAFVTESNPNCWWWLRSPGMYPDLTAFVYRDGSVDGYGDDVLNDRFCVRPALWVRL